MSNITPGEVSQLKIIENEVNSYLSSRQTNPEKCTGINSALNRVIPNALLPSKKVKIIWNSNAKEAFIMSITPDISELYEKSQELSTIMNNPKTSNAEFVRTWAEITTWYLEIDTRVLTKGNRLCVDDGSQFVALLCHEIGHVMNENPIRLLYNYKKHSLQFSTMEKLMLSKSKIIRAIILPMFIHTSQFMVVSSNINNAKACEAAADAYVPDEYKGALVSYLDNHILKDPSTSGLLMDVSDFDKEQEVAINLSKESIEMLKDRRELLNRQIQSQYNHPNNTTINRKLMRFIGKNLTGYDPESDKYINLSMHSIMENAFLREYDNAVRESMTILEATKVTDRTIDILSIQADDIKTPEDKMYILHKCYDYMEVVAAENNKKSKTMKSGSKAETDLFKDTRMERLGSIRTKIMNTKVSDVGDKYGVFVKYPVGYEG